MRSIIRNNKKIKIFLFFIFIFLSLSIGYAYLQQSLSINNTATIATNAWNVHLENIVVREGSVSTPEPVINDRTTISVSVPLQKPFDFYEFYVDIVNEGTIDAKLETITNTSLTESQQKYLNYTITYSDYVEIKKNDLLASGEKETLRIVIEMKDVVDANILPNEAITINLNCQLNYMQNNTEGVERSKNSLYNQIVKQAKPDTEINFGEISSDTNGLGVYTLSKTSNTAYPLYYYRGDVKNNNVLFANYCWKIIRTTNTGGIKLIYNGGPTEGTCNNTGEATEIGKSVFNTEQNDSKYVGYMYDNNTVNSTIKDVVDEWFQNNLLDYQSYLEDTPFYNERDYVEGVGFPRSYAARTRIWGTRTDNYDETIPNTTIKLGAINKEDIFTVSSDIGNGALTYPVGLVTSDEIILAGGSGKMQNSIEENSQYYLYTSSWNFSISPLTFYDDFRATILRVRSDGYVGGVNASESGGVRPVISLKPTITYINGNGTSASPYKINN